MCIVPNCTTAGPEPTLPCDECRGLFGDFMQASRFPPISLEQAQANEAAVREVLRARRDFVELDER